MFTSLANPQPQTVFCIFHALQEAFSLPKCKQLLAPAEKLANKGF
jgi:hypothetical protein